MHCCVPASTTDNNTSTSMMWVTLNMGRSATNRQGIVREFHIVWRVVTPIIPVSYYDSDVVQCKRHLQVSSIVTFLPYIWLVSVWQENLQHWCMFRYAYMLNSTELNSRTIVMILQLSVMSLECRKKSPSTWSMDLWSPYVAGCTSLLQNLVCSQRSVQVPLQMLPVKPAIMPLLLGFCQVVKFWFCDEF